MTTYYPQTREEEQWLDIHEEERSMTDRSPEARLKQIHRYTITSEGASKGYFRLVEDPDGAWVTWAEVEALLTEDAATRPAREETIRVAHARKQGAADGFQQGWHAALSRIRQGDKLHDMTPLVPNPAIALVEQLSNQLHAIEWVRQASGNRYACPQCHQISERDGGPGHADDCQAERLRREAEEFIWEHSAPLAARAEALEEEKP